MCDASFGIPIGKESFEMFLVFYSTDFKVTNLYQCLQTSCPEYNSC